MIIKADDQVGRIRIHPQHQGKEMDTVCKQGGEREEAAVEKGRLRAKGPKKAASFRKHSFD